jgi:hypothetical protein
VCVEYNPDTDEYITHAGVGASEASKMTSNEKRIIEKFVEENFV